VNLVPWTRAVRGTGRIALSAVPAGSVLMDSRDILGRVLEPFVVGYVYEVGRMLLYYFGALAMSLVFIGIASSRGSARGRRAR